MNRYAAARSLLSILSALAWLVIVAAAFAALGALRGGGWQGAALIAVSGLAAGVLLLAVAQMALAQIDSADNSFRTVALLEKLLNRASAAPDPARPFAAAPSGDAERPAALIKTHHGRAIWRESVGVSVDGQPFNTVLSAERWIEDQRNAQRTGV